MNIRELRKSKNMTQAAFAEAIGVKAPLITSIETGRRKLSANVIAKIKEAFGVDVEAEVKPTTSKKSAKKAATISKETPLKKGLIIQSPMGGKITPDEILTRIRTATKGERVGKPDVVYIRVDENKAFWIKGKKSGSVDLW